MLKWLLVLSFIISVPCYSYNVSTEVFRALISYEMSKKYKRNLLKAQKKILNKIPKRKIVLTALAYYSNITSDNVILNQRMLRTKNSTIFVGLEYNKTNNNITLTISNIIVL